MAELQRRSALAAAHEIDTGPPRLTLSERRPAALLRLFADVDDAGLASALSGLIGLVPPRSANTAVTHNGYSLLWLAPREWLLVCETEASIDEHRLAAALAHTSGTVVDVTHAYTVVAISGDGTRELLAKGIPIDLEAGAFGSGACAQTCLGDMNVVLHARQAQLIDLYAGRSYAVSLWEWLALSAAEVGRFPQPGS